jgi:hypothetical protein
MFLSLYPRGVKRDGRVYSILQHSTNSNASLSERGIAKKAAPIIRELNTPKKPK